MHTKKMTPPLDPKLIKNYWNLQYYKQISSRSYENKVSFYKIVPTPSYSYILTKWRYEGVVTAAMFVDMPNTSPRDLLIIESLFCSN